jgi:hypothetical protein
MKTGYTPSDVKTGDFNLDGRPDLAVSSMGQEAVSVFLQH